jgi:hypothetical protein
MLLLSAVFIEYCDLPLHTATEMMLLAATRDSFCPRAQVHPSICKFVEVAIESIE